MVRQFDLSDINTVMEIWLSTNIATHEFIPKEYWLDNFEAVKAMLPHSEILVYDDGGVRGFIGIVDTGYIAGLFVSQQFQSCGIGSKLIETCKTRYSALTLDVYLKNEKAIKFYIKHGFRIQYKKENGETKELEYTMQWLL